MTFPASAVGNINGCISIEKSGAGKGTAGIVAFAKTIRAFVDGNISVGLVPIKPTSESLRSSKSSNKNIYIGSTKQNKTTLIAIL